MGVVDVLIAGLAEAQHGLVTRRDLLDAGVHSAAIRHRVRAGRLHVVHRGVYSVGHRPLSADADSLAAVLACGPEAALNLGWAAAHWWMLSAAPDPIEVVHVGAKRTGPAGVRLRRTAHLEATIHRGVPVTTPLRTLLDLAATGHPGLELAVNEAQALKLVTHAELEHLATSGRRGSAAIRDVIQDVPGYTREEAERRLRSLILKAQLPRPRFNKRIEGHDADAVWPDQRLVIEVDGYAAHGTRHAFERDRRIDQQRTAAGYRTLRVTWHQLTRRPETVVASIAAALARS